MSLCRFTCQVCHTGTPQVTLSVYSKGRKTKAADFGVGAVRWAWMPSLKAAHALSEGMCRFLSFLAWFQISGALGWGHKELAKAFTVITSWLILVLVVKEMVTVNMADVAYTAGTKTMDASLLALVSNWNNSVLLLGASVKVDLSLVP